MFQFIRNYRRRRILRSPFPTAWDEIIQRNVPLAEHLDLGQKQRLRARVKVFVAEKNWEGCDGFEITDEVKVTVATQACLMVIEVQPQVYFDHVLSVLVYPTAYVAESVQITRAGVVTEGGQSRLGEAWWRGPVILSWKDVLAGGRLETPGHNLIFHEFAHQLDMMNGRFVDGTPPVKTNHQLQRWISVLGPEFDKLVNQCRRGHHGLIDCYGATNPAEFFAVLSEVFFEQGALLQERHPEIYDVLKDYYGLETAAWETGGSPRRQH